MSFPRLAFVATTLLGSVLFSAPSVSAQSSFGTAPSLTTAQKAQAAQVARQTEHVNTTTGYVSVSSATLAQRRLSPDEISYIENTIRTYNHHYGLTASMSAPANLSPMAYPPNTPIWLTYGNQTGQRVILYEGNWDGWGWTHMQYRHNWKNTAAAQNAVKIAVNSGKYSFQHRRTGDRNLYSEWFRTRVPFMGWKVLIQIIVEPGDANGDPYGPGAVVTGFPIQGNYKRKTWHDKPNTSIVPWWINVGYYKPGL